MKQGLWFLLGMCSLVVTSCQTPQAEQIKSIMKVIDQHSFSEPWKARVDHLDLKLNVDFDSHILSGSATYLITTYACIQDKELWFIRIKRTLQNENVDIFLPL